LEAGALGVSHSIEYQPTPYEEVLQYAQLAKKYKRTFFLHLRYSSEKQELEGVKEAIKIAQDAQVPVHIDHLHSTGGTFNMPKALELIKNGIKSGLQITTCVYPYSYWATYIPSKRFDDGWQQRYGITYHDLQVVGTGERLTKESFDKYRQGFWRLVAVPENTMDMKKTVDLALQEDFCMIGSDGGIEFSKEANNHPRGAGCFATAIRHGLNIGIPLEKMLDKMTTLPRSIVLPALEKRGKLQDDYMADVVIFDKNKIEGKATVANPNQYSEGIEAVFVNGKLAYHKKQMQTKNGMAIQY
jgi:N-acyl-D-aspartate/D-glutamate deacylase